MVCPWSSKRMTTLRLPNDPRYGRPMAETPTNWDVLIDRDDLHHLTTREAPSRPLEDGEARLQISAFGLTANNITYAAFGDTIGYWGFFPAAPGDDGVNWGRTPVWGFADVVESTVGALEVGQRVYGYLPMSSELIVEPTRITETGFFDSSAHRQKLPSTYNRYSLTAGDPSYSPDLEDAQMLLRPLFFTSFMIDDFLDDNDFFGGHTVIATSASSKTAFGTAELLSQRDGVTVVGLTSPGNVEFCESLGTYDAVFTYDQIDQLEAETPSVLIDFAGNRPVIAGVHARLKDNLKHSAIIGGTHWDVEAGAEPLEGPSQTFFFAPTQIEKRNAEWGGAELEARLGAAWTPFVQRTNELLTVDHGDGPEAITERFLEVLEGKTPPSVAYVLRP